MSHNDRVTLKDVYGFIAKAMQVDALPHDLRQEAAFILGVSGWARLLGVQDEAVTLLKSEDPVASSADALYTEGADLLFEGRD